MGRKKSSSLSVVVFAALALLWGVEVLFFYDRVASAEEERDRLASLERERAEERDRLSREAERLRKYTNKLLKGGEFVEREARETLGGAVEGEIVIRAEEN
ncbi:MAG: hypothetical protein ACI4P3_03325 [Candidatus Spyradosoma sp.]